MRNLTTILLLLTASACLWAAPGAQWAGSDSVVFYLDFEDGPYAWRAQGNPWQVGSEFDIADGGRWGKGWTNTSKMGFIGFDGTDNVPLQAGTVSMWIKSGAANIFADGKTHCFASLPRTLEGLFGTPELQSTRGLTLSVRKTAGNTIDLIAHIGAGHYIWPMPTETLLSMDAAALDASTSHQVLFSWDFTSRKVWLAVDDQVMEGAIPTAITEPHQYLCAIFGNSQHYQAAAQEPLDGMMDDIAILDVPYPEALEVMSRDTPYSGERPADPTWTAEPTLFAADENLSQIETVARQQLDMLVATQRCGGWTLGFRWPSMLQYTAKTRMPDPKNKVWLSKDGHTAFAAIELLHAYECIGDERYLQAARNTADMYIAAQDEELGAWVHAYFLEGGRYLPEADVFLMQDHVQTGPLMLLAYIYKVTGEEAYLDAARRSADFLVRAQNPNGSWSHHFDREKNAGVTSTGVVGGGEVNDYGTSGPVAHLLEFYRLTGEEQYRDAALRGADWLVAAFIENENVAGWAGQYNDQNQPEAARHHEPAAVSQYGARWAARGLIAAYTTTLDEKYLAPLDRALEWFEASKLEGGWWWDYDTETGRPIRMWRRIVYYLDDPEQVAAYLEATGYAEAPKPSDAVHVEQLAYEVKGAREHPEGKVYAQPSREALEKQVADSAPHFVDYYIGSTSQPFNTRAGLFTWDSQAGQAAGLVRHQIVRFCNLLMRARALQGDVPVDHPYFTQLDAYVGWQKVHACPGPAPAE